MLGGLLIRQDEEEERKRRQQQQSTTSHPPPPHRNASSPSPGHSRANAEDDDDDDEEYSYDDDDDDDDDDNDVVVVVDDDDDDESSYRRLNGGGNENTYLLRRSSSIRGGGGGRGRRRRRNDRIADESVDGVTWGRRISHLWSRMRSVMVALADVDNVWDSPDAHSSLNRDRTRRRDVVDDDVYGGRGERSGGGNNGMMPASRIIYDVISSGGGGGGRTNGISSGGVDDNDDNARVDDRRRTALIFWFVVLFTSYAFERSTFKLLVDRVGPFRLFSADLILGVHALLTGFGMILGNAAILRGGGGGGGGRGDGGKRRRDVEEMMELGALPLADIGLMAVFDTVYLLLSVISGAHVPPVLTVILVQTTIPLTACFTQCVHPDGLCASRSSSPGDGESTSPGDISTMPYPPTAPDPAPVRGWGGLSRYHITGTCLMFLAIFIGLIPAVLSLHHIVITEEDAMPDRTAYNTIVFCFAAVPAAMSQLYKEQTLTRLRQPIDRNALNMVLSIFQLLFAIVVSPLAYGLQGMGNGPGWTGLYPSRGMGENFSNGFKCFIGTLDDETMNTGYPEDADCEWSAALVFLHVLSIIMVGVAIDKLAAATKVMYRGVSMGIIFAVILMFWYQIRDRWCQYGPLVSFFHLTSTAVLIVGAEIYHRVSLVDASFETVYPEIADLYDDEE